MLGLSRNEARKQLPPPEEATHSGGRVSSQRDSRVVSQPSQLRAPSIRKYWYPICPYVLYSIVLLLLLLLLLVLLLFLFSFFTFLFLF